jgi:hypothetical protein
VFFAGVILGAVAMLAIMPFIAKAGARRMLRKAIEQTREREDD